MKLALFGPLSWKQNIWNRFVQQLNEETNEMHEYTFFEFPHCDVAPHEYEEKILSILQNESFDTIIACSYGVNFFLYMLQKYDLSYLKTEVILIDGVLNMESTELIRHIQATRDEAFTSIETYKHTLLGDVYTAFEEELLESVYDRKQNCLIFSNDQLAMWIRYIDSSFRQSEMRTVKQQIPKLTVFSQNKLWVETLDVRRFIEIESNEHLLMVENPGKIISVLCKN